MELMLGLLPPPQVEIPPKLVALADEVIDETLITLFGGAARVADFVAEVSCERSEAA